jgi:hypothetical protein
MMAELKLLWLWLMTEHVDCYQWGIEELPVQYDICLSCGGDCVKKGWDINTV